MRANSSPVTSSQTGIHEHLGRALARHVASPFLKPIADYNRAAFDTGMTAWKQAGELPLILDAGCGVGLSTLHLASRYPDHFVIGVDQSADRLARNTDWPGTMPDNFILVRADLVDYWRLLQAAGIRLARHYLLYPNPWPKIGHMTRRWHGHAVFPSIVALGGYIECRSNWPIYVEEFTMALRQLAYVDVTFAEYKPLNSASGDWQSAITPFEKKYLASGHTLWRCHATLK